MYAHLHTYLLAIFSTELKLQLLPVLVTLKSTALEDSYEPATREIYMGCVRTMAVSQKKVRNSFKIIAWIDYPPPPHWFYLVLFG